MADKNALIVAAKEFFTEASAYLRATVKGDAAWETEQPEVDSARTAVSEMLEAIGPEEEVTHAKQEDNGSKEGWWMVIGSVGNDDEDSAAWIRCNSEAVAIANFRQVMINRLRDNEYAGEEGWEYDEEADPIYINWIIFTGETRPKIISSPNW